MGIIWLFQNIWRFNITSSLICVTVKSIRRRFCGTFIIWSSCHNSTSELHQKQVTWLVVTEVQRKSFGLVTECRHAIGVLCAVSHIFVYWMASYMWSLTFLPNGCPSWQCTSYFSLLSVVSRAFYALCVIWCSGIIHTLGYLCAKFVSVAPSIAE